MDAFVARAQRARRRRRAAGPGARARTRHRATRSRSRVDRAIAAGRIARGAAQRHAPTTRAGSAAPACTGPAQRSLAATARPRDLVVGASCHTRAEIAHAARSTSILRCWVPCSRRRRIPDATSARLERICRGGRGNTRAGVRARRHCSRPISTSPIAHGAHGIAMRRYAWPPADALTTSSRLGAIGSADSGASDVFDAVALARPRAEVDRLAALGTERPPFRFGGPWHGRPALRALDDTRR